MDDNLRLRASEIEYFLETGEGLDSLANIFEKVIKLLKEEGGPNFVLGKVIIVNDLKSDEEDEDDE